METIAKLFTNGRSQAVRIPKAYQFDGVDRVLIRKEGDALVILPARKDLGVLCRRGAPRGGTISWLNGPS